MTIGCVVVIQFEIIEVGQETDFGGLFDDGILALEREGGLEIATYGARNLSKIVRLRRSESNYFFLQLFF